MSTYPQRKGGGRSFTREYDQRDHAMASQNALTAATAAVGFEFELAKYTGELPPASVEERVLYYQDLFYNLHMSKVEGQVQEAAAAVVRQIPSAQPDTSTVEVLGNGAHLIGFGQYKDLNIAQAYEKDQQYVRNFLAEVMQPRNDTGKAAQEAAKAYVAEVDAA